MRQGQTVIKMAWTTARRMLFGSRWRGTR